MPTAGDLLDLATSLLGDPGNDVWGRTELLGYLNDGLHQLAFYRPDQFVENQTLTLVDGVKQLLPDDIVTIISPVCNLDATGLIRGRVIRLVNKQLLDAASPAWQLATADETRQLALGPDANTEFYVSPPAVAGTKIEVLCEVNPVAVTQGTTLTVDNKYHPALVNYTCFRALSVDADYGAQDGRALVFYQTFVGIVKRSEEPGGPDAAA